MHLVSSRPIELINAGLVNFKTPQTFGVISVDEQTVGSEEIKGFWGKIDVSIKISVLLFFTGVPVDGSVVSRLRQILGYAEME